jgi:hypothetical protein
MALDAVDRVGGDELAALGVAQDRAQDISAWPAVRVRS